MPQIAATSRLIIRTWDESDVNALCRLTQEPGVGDFAISSYRNFSAEKARQWIALEQQRFHKCGLARFAIELAETREIIGISGIFEMLPPDEDKVELNYRYSTQQRDQGYATEAAKAILEYGFKTLKLSSVDAVTEPENEPSKRVLRRLGFSKIGDLEYEGRPWEQWRNNAER